MASPNLEFVTAITDPWERGDFSSVEWAHPDIEYVHADGPTPGAWKGVREMGRVWGEWLSGAFADWRSVRGETIELDDERVLSIGRTRARAQSSGLEIDEQTGAVLFHIRDGSVTKLVLYWDREQAIADAGLPPGTSPETLVYLQGAKAFSERGVEALAETWNDDVVYEEDPLWPGAATHRGRDAVAARLREYEEQLGRSTVSIERLVEGSRGIVVLFRNAGVTPAAGVPFQHRWAWLVQARDGKAAHIRAYFDPDEALRAAGSGGR